MTSKREISRQGRRNPGRIRVTVIGEPILQYMDPTGTKDEVWTCRCEWEGRIIEDVVVKSATIQGGGRGFARLGMPCWADRNASGRYELTGPADRVSGVAQLILVNEETGATSSPTPEGLTTTLEPFGYYQGVLPSSFFDPTTDPDTLVWLTTYERQATTTPTTAGDAPLGVTVDQDINNGNLAQIADQSGNANHVTTDGNVAALYKKNDTNFNMLSTSGWNGSSREGDFASNIPGEVLSIFIQCVEVGATAGDDVLLETEEWQVRARQSGSDEWGIGAGGGQNLSGQSLAGASSDIMLIEMICNGFEDVDLYQDGASLGNFTAGPASGNGFAQSSLGYSGDLSDRWFRGRIGAVLILDRAVNETDRLAIEAMFNQQWQVAFARWGDGVTGFPAITTTDQDGNEV